MNGGSVMYMEVKCYMYIHVYKREYENCEGLACCHRDDL